MKGVVMRGFLPLILLLVVVEATGCSSVPPKNDPANWHEVELGPQLTGKWFADEAEFVLTFRFDTKMTSVLAFRAVDIPGNGFDIYTLDGVLLRRLSDTTYQMTLPRHFQLDYQLFFRLEWKRRKEDWATSRLFLFENNKLYYSDD